MIKHFCLVTFVQTVAADPVEQDFLLFDNAVDLSGSHGRSGFIQKYVVDLSAFSAEKVAVADGPEIVTVFSVADADAADVAVFRKLIQVPVDGSEADGRIFAAHGKIDLIRSGMIFVSVKAVPDQFSLFGKL